jgi:hypothetical protein
LPVTAELVGQFPNTVDFDRSCSLAEEAGQAEALGIDAKGFGGFTVRKDYLLDGIDVVGNVTKPGMSPMLHGMVEGCLCNGRDTGTAEVVGNAVGLGEVQGCIKSFLACHGFLPSCFDFVFGVMPGAGSWNVCPLS